MNVKNPLLQTVILIALALVVAIVANGFASRQRRLVLPGRYPDALVLPKSEPAPAPLATMPSAVTTTAAGPTPKPVETATAPAVVATTSSAPVEHPAPATATAVQPILVPPVKPATETSFQPHPDKAYVELGGDDVASLYKSGALFLDARRTSVFEEGHIAGARSFPVWESDIDDRVNALFAERGEPADQNKPIVIYCTGGACEDSHMLAQKLWGIQFNNVYVYKDGFPDWQKRGGAVRKGGDS